VFQLFRRLNSQLCLHAVSSQCAGVRRVSSCICGYDDIVFDPLGFSGRLIIEGTCTVAFAAFLNDINSAFPHSDLAFLLSAQTRFEPTLCRLVLILIHMLCETCQAIFKGSLGPGEQLLPQKIEYHRDHHQRLLELHNAVLQGCFICDALFQRLYSLWTGSTSYHIKGKCFLTSSRDRLDLTVRYKLRRATQEDIQAMQEISGATQEDTQDTAGLANQYFALLPTRSITKLVIY
jgi:hypothetical protein